MVFHDAKQLAFALYPFAIDYMSHSNGIPVNAENQGE